MSARKMTDAQIAEAVLLYESGAVRGVTELGQRYGVHLTTVCRRLRRAGVRLRSRGAPKGSRGANNAAKYGIAVERYRNGETSFAIGRDLGVTPQTVVRWAKHAGVEPHPMGRAPKRYPVAAEVIDNVVARINTSAPAQTPLDRVLELHAQGVARKVIAHEGVPHAAIAEAFGVSCAYVGLLAREGKERAA